MVTLFTIASVFIQTSLLLARVGRFLQSTALDSGPPRNSGYPAMVNIPEYHVKVSFPKTITMTTRSE